MQHKRKQPSHGPTTGHSGDTLSLPRRNATPSSPDHPGSERRTKPSQPHIVNRASRCARIAKGDGVTLRQRLQWPDKCLLPCCLHGRPSGKGDAERRKPLWDGPAIEGPNTQGCAPAQPSPAGAQAVASPTLGKQLAPPRLVVPAALPGAADHGAHGGGEQTEGERDREFRGKGRGYGCLGEPWEGRE